ncbi:MAG: LLM class F420-dependent oxidoreductase [Acidimicrobiales bacterium]
MQLGELGVWWSGSWRREDGAIDVAAELEELGYGAIWSSGGFEPGLSRVFERLLAATSRIVVASGIVTVWHSSPGDVAAAFAGLDDRFPGRFLLGLGASHAALVENYSRPYSRMVAYLDGLDAESHPVPRDRRVLAALKPRMLELARDRAVGAHPYFVTVEHTARARAILGSGPLLAPEVTVLLERDPATARDLARSFTTGYLGLPNYANNLLSIGYDEDDLEGGGSDRLVDAVVFWGDVETVATKVRAHYEAGADHVCIQVLSGSRGSFPVAEYRELAGALLGS